MISLSGKAMLASLVFRVTPEMYSVTRKSVPFWVSKSKTVAMFGWFRRERVRASLRNRLRAASSASVPAAKTLMAAFLPVRALMVTAIDHAYAPSPDLLYDPVVTQHLADTESGRRHYENVTD